MLEHKQCQQCGKEYDVYPQKGRNHRFCSFKCWTDFEAKHKSRVKLTCEYCGKEYEVIPARAKISRFCSKKCIHAFLGKSKKNKPRSSEVRWKISNGHRLRWQMFRQNPENPDAKEAFSQLKQIRRNITKQSFLKASSSRMGFKHDFLIEKEVMPIMHDLLFNYVLKNPSEFGYTDVYVFQGSNFDLIGINPNGVIERIEIERSAHQYLHWHDPEDCDRVISYYNTKKQLKVPLTLVPKDKFIPFAERFLNLLKKANVSLSPHKRITKQLNTNKIY